MMILLIHKTNIIKLKSRRRRYKNIPHLTYMAMLKNRETAFNSYNQGDQFLTSEGIKDVCKFKLFKFIYTSNCFNRIKQLITYIKAIDNVKIRFIWALK